MTTISSNQLCPTADLHARVLAVAQRYADRRISGLEADDLARDLAVDVARMLLNRRNVMLAAALAALVKGVVSTRLRHLTGRKRHRSGRPRSPRGRRVYVLVYGDGMSVRACSLAPGLPDQAVNFRLRAARRRHEEALGELGVATLRDVMPRPSYHDTTPQGGATMLT